ncbi:PTS system N-acetylgalactosamine-specific IIA component [Breznakia sp. PF5-3]|uniref:PTS sugar transporter subunit IIA n=1 Tax=unclassified Breznakia TaxID=2623764 RepID=UPI002406AF14|nr:MULTISPECIES: PTS sugar transporter subunit IIA [unclassified Breznakia]MDF9824253.1 PTS system N-acetylgalactosamine-specific IIA component [Breznakia sp. PM6-1]MDF9835180.1 PTS system N-acetylgalactosamine-specific IIA component [Breznakia sp. PF5-3]MDF9837292.1 PTS system N-acetylgalactosamine-specific IIA component [Breznakia sp. PFB2-8]MDF9859427.1 PTS system N-acetylgalactosamine-specific IIA component [Breznakia sp. PH5-24]
MFGIMVIGHGNFPSGMKSAIEVIAGKQEKIQYIDFSQTDTATELEKNIKQGIEVFRDEDNILVFADLLSGSPFNTAIMEAMKDQRIKVFYGVNLGMLLEVIVKRGMGASASEIEANASQTGIEQIGMFNPLSIDDEDDEFNS